jgi:hypothetical protein
VTSTQTPSSLAAAAAAAAAASDVIAVVVVMIDNLSLSFLLTAGHFFSQPDAFG